VRVASKFVLSLGWLVFAACDERSETDNGVATTAPLTEKAIALDEPGFDELAPPELVLQELHSIEEPLVQGRLPSSPARAGMAGDTEGLSGYYAARVRLLDEEAIVWVYFPLDVSLPADNAVMNLAVGQYGYYFRGVAGPR
jgi:hypothetical protein